MISSLTHDEPSRTDTTLTFSWLVMDGGGGGMVDCSDITLCIAADCKPGLGLTGSTTFTGLAPGTNHMAVLTVTSTDGLDDTEMTNGKTSQCHCKCGKCVPNIGNMNKLLAIGT